MAYRRYMLKRLFFVLFFVKIHVIKKSLNYVLYFFITIFIDMYTKILYNPIHIKHTEIVWNQNKGEKNDENTTTKNQTNKY